MTTLEGAEAELDRARAAQQITSGVVSLVALSGAAVVGLTGTGPLKNEVLFSVVLIAIVVAIVGGVVMALQKRRIRRLRAEVRRLQGLVDSYPRTGS